MRVPNSMIVGSGVAVVLVSTWAWAEGSSDPQKYAYGPHMMGWGGGWSGMMFGPLFMIFILVVIIAVAILFVRWLGGLSQGAARHQPAPAFRTPLDILKERFARGEIDKEEFEDRRRVLGD